MSGARSLFPCTPMTKFLALPFRGRWFVMQGGDTLNVNHHMAFEPQWYGIDFARVGGPAERDLGPDTIARCEDFYGWGAEVLAPVDGTVVDVDDQQPDNELGVKDPTHPAGNYVILEHAERFYCLAHFQCGSLRVHVGDRIIQGQVLGSCGNSGNSDFPHIHLHVSDASRFDQGRGTNMVFGPIDVELSGKRFTNVEWPLTRGLFVANHQSALRAHR
jgi:hypothetical protein